jgi:nitrite reductase (NADH) small subunit
MTAASAENWYRVGAVDELPLGRPVETVAGSMTIGVVRLASGIHAFRNECPHQGAPLCRGYFAGTMVPSAPSVLEYGLEEEVIRCPWHGWEFHIPSGEALFGISTRRLRKFDVEIRDDDVYVRIPGMNRETSLVTGAATRGEGDRAH